MDSKTLTLLQSLSFPYESEVHVARHLVDVPERLLSKMSLAAEKKSMIYDGSKFSPTFISDTNQLISKILEFGLLNRFNNVNYSQLELEFGFPESTFPNGIEVNRQISSKPVYSLVLILHRSKGKWEVTTSFPGKLKTN